MFGLRPDLLSHQHGQHLDHGQVGEVGLGAHVHHRVVGHLQGHRQVGQPRQGRVSLGERDDTGALPLGHVHRLQQGRHAAHV